MREYHLIYLFFAIIFYVINGSVSAQGLGNPLVFQGVDHSSYQSVSSKASGGLIFGTTNDLTLMFSNPALLQMTKGLEISFGSTLHYSESEQVQQYSPLKYYTNFSLFMEGLTRQIPNPQYDTLDHKPVNAGDSVQRPFDQLSPNWNHSRSYSSPVQAFAAIPFSIGEMKITLGIGMTEFANLNWYYQNNNVLSPSILSPNSYTRSRPLNDADSSSIPVQWYQFSQQREGSINGFGGAISINPSENLSFGVSAMILLGTTDDKETRTERGRIRFYQNYFRAESVYYHISQNGTSDFSGEEISLSGYYHGKAVGFGIAVKLPTTITRKTTATIITDTTGSTISVKINKEDQMTIPFRGTIGMTIALRENISLGVEYELRPLADAEFKNSAGSTSTPWHSSNIFHFGLSYAPIPELVLHAGAREQPEVFEPFGNPLAGETVNSTVYSAGASFVFSNLKVNIAYEYFKMKYVDTWSSEVSINKGSQHSISADISYELPW